MGSAGKAQRSVDVQWIPPGKRLHNYGKSPFLIGKSTINGPFSIANYVSLPEAFAVLQPNISCMSDSITSFSAFELGRSPRRQAMSQTGWQIFFPPQARPGDGSPPW